jgi:hypothetical protein
MEIETRNSPWYLRMFMNSGRYSDVCFGIGLSQQFEANAVVCRLLTCVCSMSTPDLIQPVIPWNRFRISNCRCYSVRHIHQIWQPAIFTSFLPLKDALRRRNLRSNEEVKKTVHDWLVQQPNDFSRGIYALVERWKRCVEHDGDYTEDKCHCTVSTSISAINLVPYSYINVIRTEHQVL